MLSGDLLLVCFEAFAMEYHLLIKHYRMSGLQGAETILGGAVSSVKYS